jgi:hypothetical protein
MCSVKGELGCSVKGELRCSVKGELGCFVKGELRCSVKGELGCSVKDLSLRCLMPLSTIFQLYHGGPFYYWRTQRKPQTCWKLLRNFIT